MEITGSKTRRSNKNFEFAITLGNATIISGKLMARPTFKLKGKAELL